MTEYDSRADSTEPQNVAAAPSTTAVLWRCIIVLLFPGEQCASHAPDIVVNGIVCHGLNLSLVAWSCAAAGTGRPRGAVGTPQSTPTSAMAPTGEAEDRPAPLTAQEQGMFPLLMHADDVLKARLAADEKYVRRIAKRVAQLAKGGTDTERYVCALAY